jgi:hypothetical protein
LPLADNGFIRQNRIRRIGICAFISTPSTTDRSFRPNLKLWLQGALILENRGGLVIPACQIRALWAGITTGYAGLRISKTVIVQPGSTKLKKTGLDRNGGVLSQEKGTLGLDRILVLFTLSGIWAAVNISSLFAEP